MYLTLRRLQVAQEKIGKSRLSDKPSPFTGRRSETEVFSNRRRSFMPGGEAEKVDSPEELVEGDDSTRRGRGLGGDLLKVTSTPRRNRRSMSELL